MKKTFTALSVLAAAICCTLAFAVTKHGALPTLFSFGTSANEAASGREKIGQNLQIDKASMAFAKSKVADKRARHASQRADAAGSTTETITNDLLHSAEHLELTRCEYDINTNVLTFNTSSGDNFFMTATDAAVERYQWMAVRGATYTFSGTISADNAVTVNPVIIYVSNQSLFVKSSDNVTLNADNNYTANFSTETIFDVSVPLYIGFLVSGYDETTVNLTSTNNAFTCSYTAAKSEKWSAETDLPGLGLSSEFGDNLYTVKCEDGITTLGVVKYDNYLQVTGINTTATDVTFPGTVSIEGSPMSIHVLGNEYGFSWEGAPNLKSLDISPVTTVENCNFRSSAITDLYVNESLSFYGTGHENIYLHLPNSLQDIRHNFTNKGFKRVLVGEETSEYPETQYSYWVMRGSNDGEYFGLSMNNGNIYVSEIFSSNEQVTLPSEAYFKNTANDGYFQISGAGRDSNIGSVMTKNAPNLTSLTFSPYIQNINIDWNSTKLTQLHMTGDVPEVSYTIPESYTVYVQDSNYYSNYKNSSNWSHLRIVPEGWEFEWMTVDVKRKGEFAQTYIEMTDADWSQGMYVKVTGTLSSDDLTNMKKLTNLIKLDLSEATCEGLPDYFMNDMATLEEVMLPACIQYISRYAFANCTNLTTVTAPGVELLMDDAFYKCGNLRTFDISKVTYIGTSAFEYCTYYSPEKFSDKLSTIRNRAFANSGIKEAMLPEGIKEIEYSTFSGCGSLAKVSLPSTMQTIGNEAFYKCRKLTEINIPEGVTAIGSNAFRNCELLPEITLPSTLSTIGYSSFDYCNSLLSIKCKAIVPPASSGSFAYNVDFDHATLYVAPFAIDAYRAAEGWKDFFIMKPLNEPVKNIYICRAMTFDLQSADNAVLQDNPNLTLDYNNRNEVGQLTAAGDGTLSAGVFKILHRFDCRDDWSSDFRPSLINNAENMRADSVLCSILFEKNYWHFISFQYDVRMEDIFGVNGTDFAIRQYNGKKRASGDSDTGNWENVPADGTLLAGKGYIIQAANNTQNNGNYVPAIVRFPSRNTTTKNNLFTSKNVIVSLEEFTAEFAHNRSWNLVGNPYPCYYNMQCLQDEFTSPITLWRGNSYQAYSPLDDIIILRPNEAFFVQRPLDAAEMVFGAEGRMHYEAAYNATYNNNANPGISYAPAAESNSRSVFNFTLNGCGSNDRARIVINEKASMDYESERDASKFFAETSAGTEIYVNGNTLYSICERPFDNGKATLGMRVGASGEYTLALDGRHMEGWKVLLTDNATGMTVNIAETAYTFECEAGNYADRFSIEFKAPGTLGVDNLNGATESTVTVLDVAGLEVFSGAFADFKATARPGVYVVIANGKATKIVVR